MNNTQTGFAELSQNEDQPDVPLPHTDPQIPPTKRPPVEKPPVIPNPDPTPLPDIVDPPPKVDPRNAISGGLQVQR